MDYKINTQNKEKYKEELVKRTYRILKIYEDCSAKENLYDFESYLIKVCIELKGCEFAFDNTHFLSLYSILLGLLDTYKDLSHKQIKSIVFHAIDLVKKDW